MNESTAVMPLWMLILATFGFMIGWVLGEELSRRRCAEEKVKELRDQLRRLTAPTVDPQLREMRRVLNNTHKHILALSKYIDPH